jgi:hypothetical protein
MRSLSRSKRTLLSLFTLVLMVQCCCILPIGFYAARETPAAQQFIQQIESRLPALSFDLDSLSRLID